jgi:hypothetical protein
VTDALVPLVVGFMLTTVFGGALGWFFQNRTWQNQNEARLREDELRRADDVCRSLSSLLDKRLYRMLRLFHALRADTGSTRSEAVEERLRDYDVVLFEWNDALNLHLALVGTYFGDSARLWLDEGIYVGFRELGLRLEARYRALGGDASTQDDDTEIESSFAALNDEVYRFGLLMMTRLRDGAVGRNAPDMASARTR